MRFGRRVGTAVFWVLVLFVSGSATLSIVTQVFPNLARKPTATDAHVACAEAMPGLRDDLLAYLRELPEDRDEADLNARFARWDERYHALGRHCGDLEQTRVELRRLRDAVHAMMRRFQRREAPRLDRIQRALDNLPLTARPAAST